MSYTVKAINNFFFFTPYSRYYLSLYNWVNYIIWWILCVSVTYSLYYLILFYIALREPLKQYKPLQKFLVVKITLFFTFWQAFTLHLIDNELLQCFDKESPLYNENLILISIENTLILFEMLIMSLASLKAFTFHEFKLGYVKKGKMMDAIKDNILCFLQDFRLIKPKKFGFQSKAEVIELSEQVNIRPSIMQQY